MEIANLKIVVERKFKKIENSIQSAFLKSGTVQTFIQIGLDQKIAKQFQSNEVLKIKIEIDVNPPQEFKTEFKYRLTPIPFAVRTYVQEDLFAGKMHAILCRPYKVRVKGRDWYDLIWYISKNIPLHLKHLESRMKQSQHLQNHENLTQDLFLNLLEKKIETLDIKAAKEDIFRFISNFSELEIWSKEFFSAISKKIKFI